MGCSVSKPEWIDVYRFMLEAIFGHSAAPVEAVKSGGDLQSLAQQLLRKIEKHVCQSEVVSRIDGRSAPGRGTVSFARITAYADEVWHLTNIHPFNIVLMRIAASQIKRAKSMCIDFTAQELLQWLIFICEFYHIMSILESCPPLDGTISNVFARMQSIITRAQVNDLLNGSTDEMSVVVDKQLRKFYSVNVKVDVISTAIIKRIGKNMPYIFDIDVNSLSTYPNAVSSRSSTSSFDATKVRKDIIEACFSTSALSSTSSYSSSSESQRKKSTSVTSSTALSVSFGHFVCCVLMQYVSLFGCSELAKSGFSSSPILKKPSLSSPNMKSGLCDSSVSGVVASVGSLSPLLKELREITKQLRSAQAGSEDIKSKLTLRMECINAKLADFFCSITSSSSIPMTESRACDYFYTQFAISCTKPPRQAFESMIHDAFSRVRARNSSSGSFNSNRSSKSSLDDQQVISSLSDFCVFLEFVVAFFARLQRAAAAPSRYTELWCGSGVSAAPQSDAVMRLQRDAEHVERTWWWAMCNNLPHSSSPPHQHERLSLLCILSGAGGSSLQRPTDCGVHSLRCDVLTRLLNDKYHVGHMLLYAIRARDGDAFDVATTIYDKGKAATDENCVQFMQQCISAVNGATIQDSAIGANHTEHLEDVNFRFLLQYIHNFLITFLSLHDLIRQYRQHADLCSVKQFLIMLIKVMKKYTCTGIAGAVASDIFAVIRDEQNRRKHNEETHSKSQSWNANDSGNDCVYDACDTFFAQLCQDKTFCSSVSHAVATILLKIQLSITCTVERMLINQPLQPTNVNGADVEKDDKSAIMDTCLLTLYSRATQTHWNQLRYLLPFGDSAAERAQREELFDKMNTQSRNYITLENIRHGITHVLSLNGIRSDLTPVFFRAFAAVLEKSLVKDSVIYLNVENEQFIEKDEFGDFLYYFYRYMELYYMYDVLRCVGYVDPDTLHVSSEKCNSRTDFSATTQSNGSVDDTQSSISIFDQRSGQGYNKMNNSQINAVCRAACNPAQIISEAVNIPKEVTVDQFVNARCLLRLWGFYASDAVYVFKYINRHSSNKDILYFTYFAVWASEHGLRPQGYYRASYANSSAFVTLEQECMKNITQSYT